MLVVPQEPCGLNSSAVLAAMVMCWGLGALLRSGCWRSAKGTGVQRMMLAAGNNAVVKRCCVYGS